jgi:uncharacterized protein (DUF924 family)
MDHRRLLDFWFGEGARHRWFTVDRAFDEELRRNFGPWVEAALAGELAAWEATPDGSLALILLLDQLPRNLFRASRRAYEGDPAVRRIADQSVARGFDRRVPPDRRLFFYLPFQHSEDAVDQRRSVRLVGALAADLPQALGDAGRDWLDWALRHQALIERFGRFPQRNASLGRAATEAEDEYLATTDPGF